MRESDANWWMTPTKATGLTKTARSPGKLILAGEHAVVYGRPALVSAISVYARCEAELLDEKRVKLAAPDLGYLGEFPIGGLGDLYEDISERKKKFDAGKIEASELMLSPEELPWYAAVLAWRAAGSPLVGWSMVVRSEIPQDSGCGSSAAISSAIIGAVSCLLGSELSREEQFNLVLEAEKLRHGRPSGVDPAAVVYGGVLRYQQREWERLSCRLPLLTLVDTGRPESSTGECVAAVRRKWADSTIWDEFERVVDSLQESLSDDSGMRLRDAVRENHHLLCRIGVVPGKVRSFIEQVEKRGGAGKISGAGSIRGAAAGVVWVVRVEERELRDLVHTYGYRIIRTQADEHGFTTG